MEARTLYILVFVIYICLMEFIGYLVNKRGIKDLTDYFLAGKGAPWYLVMLSFFATGIGAGGTYGLSAKVYKMQSIAAFWSYGIAILSFFVVAILLGHILPGTKNITIPELLEERYDTKTRIAAVPLYLLRFISTLGAQWIAAGTILQFFFPQLSLSQAIVIGAILITLYTTLGGMGAVMWTDFVQGIVLFIGLWALALRGISYMGGFSSMHAQVVQVAPQAFNLFAMKKSLILGYVVTLIPTMLVRQGYLQRIMAARSPRDGRLGTALNGVLGLLYIPVPLLIGVMGLVLYPNIGNPKSLINQMASDLFPPIGTAIVVTALAAAVMSSADSFLLSGASNITEDIYHRFINKNADQRKLVLVSRLSVIVLMILSVGITVLIPDIIDLIVFGALGLTAGVLVPWLALFYWPRGTSDAAFWSIVVGGGSAIAWWWAGYFAHTSEFMGLHPVFIGLPLSIIIFVVVSLIQKPEYEKVLEVAKKHNLKHLEKKVQKILKNEE